MKNTLSLVLGSILALATVTVGAQDSSQPNAQWRLRATVSLFSLVQSGYTVVSVTNGQGGGQMFYLQKGPSFYKCLEDHVNDFKRRQHDAFIHCWELLEPYRS